MLKRIGAFTVALLITVVGMVMWWIFSISAPLCGLEIGPTSLRVDGPPFLLATCFLGASVTPFRNNRSPAVTLLFVGCAALFIARLHDIALGLALDYQWEAVRRLLFGFGCLETPAVAMAMDVLRLTGLLIPVGFLCYATPLLVKASKQAT